MVMCCYGHVAQPRKFYAGSVCCSAHIVYLNPQLAPLCDAPFQPELVDCCKTGQLCGQLAERQWHQYCTAHAVQHKCGRVQV